MKRTDHEHADEMEATWRGLLVTGLPLVALAAVSALVLSYHDFWDTRIDRWIYLTLFSMVVIVWTGTVTGRFSLALITRGMVFGSAFIMVSKLALIYVYLPDPQRQVEELTQLLVWVSPVITWAMLTELSYSVRRGLKGMLLGITLLSCALVWKTWVTQHALQPGYVGVLFQLSLAAFVTLYGASSFIHRNDVLGRLRGEREALARLAYLDLLTGLPGRLRLNEELQRLTTPTTPARTAPQPFALLFIDVDNFKVINDTLGHETGDRILQVVAAELLRHVPPGAAVYRISGDEFVAVLPEHTAAQAEVLARRLQQFTQERVGQEAGVSTTLSIGVSLYPDDADDPVILLRHADSAMYSVKRSGRSQVRRYHPEQDSVTERYQVLSRELGLAVARRELHLMYQPIFDLNTMQLSKVEVLLRWMHPELGNVPPAEFIPVAERSGLITKLGRWVLAEACRNAKRWPGLKVSVNISAVELLRTDFVDVLTALLETEGLPVTQLELELTETALLYDDDRAIQIVRQLRRMGISVSVDDFGSGYSNLMRLRSLNISGLKLDRDIVTELVNGKAREFAEAVTRAALAICNPLNIELTMEGLETPEHVKAVQALGCKLGQGYGLQVPMTWDDLTRQYLDVPFRSGRADKQV